ncbi:hypothetical protein ACLOAV_007809 [Pseudogymnoascus australis]
MESAQPPSPERQLRTSRLEVLDDAYLLEEETFSWYSPDDFYHVRIAEVFQSKYQVLGHEYVTLKVFVSDHRQAENEEKVYHHLSTIKTNHPGVKGIRSLRDSFQLPGKRGPHECLIHDALGLTLGEIREMSDGGKVSVDLLKPFTTCLLLALDFLHTEAHYSLEPLRRLILCGADIQEGNIMLAMKDDAIFKAFEQEEMDEPSLRKVYGERIIYASRALDVPDDASHNVLCDFGDAQFGAETYGGEVMPDLYRAPEIVLGICWNEKIDIWAVGMMVWDLYEGKHLFKERLPSRMESVPAHIARMIELLGPPPKELLKRGQFSGTFFDEDEAKLYLQHILGDPLCPSSLDLATAAKSNTPSTSRLQIKRAPPYATAGIAKQKFCGSAFAITTKIPRESFMITQGSPKEHVGDNGSGVQLHREFCDECGSGILEYAEPATEYTYIMYGTLDEPNELPPKGEFFCSRREKWMPEIPGIFHKQIIKE